MNKDLSKRFFPTSLDLDFSFKLNEVFLGIFIQHDANLFLSPLEQRSTSPSPKGPMSQLVNEKRYREIACTDTVCVNLSALNVWK